MKDNETQANAHNEATHFTGRRSSSRAYDADSRSDRAMSAKNSQIKGQEDEGKLGDRHHISRRAESPQTRHLAQCRRT